MRRPSLELLRTFLISLIAGFVISYIFMRLILQVTLRTYGATFWIIAILTAILLIFVLDKPLNLKVFEWPQAAEEDDYISFLKLTLEKAYQKTMSRFQSRFQ